MGQRLLVSQSVLTSQLQPRHTGQLLEFISIMERPHDLVSVAEVNLEEGENVVHTGGGEIIEAEEVIIEMTGIMTGDLLHQVGIMTEVTIATTNTTETIMAHQGTVRNLGIMTTTIPGRGILGTIETETGTTRTGTGARTGTGRIGTERETGTETRRDMIDLQEITTSEIGTMKGVMRGTPRLTTTPVAAGGHPAQDPHLTEGLTIKVEKVLF